MMSIKRFTSIYGKAISLLVAFLLGISFLSCQKDLPYSCYDKAFHQTHKDDICTQDCPGVIGCDGKTYCNECIMNTHGIKKTQ